MSLPADVLLLTEFKHKRLLVEIQFTIGLG